MTPGASSIVPPDLPRPPRRGLGFGLWLACLLTCAAVSGVAQTLDLSHGWRTRLDPELRGLEEGWFDGDFTRAGPWTDDARAEEPGTPRRRHLGVAWYAREVEIPGWWQGERIELYLERCPGLSRVWVDGRDGGSREGTLAAHLHDLSSMLTPGRHRLLLRVDHRSHPAPDIGNAGASASGPLPWNGPWGCIELRATPKVRIAQVQVFPDVTRSLARVAVTLDNAWNAAGAVTVTLRAETLDLRRRHVVAPQRYEVDLGFGGGTADLEYPLGDGARRWLDKQPALYRLRVDLGGVLQDRGVQHQTTVIFGLREVGGAGDRFLLDHRPVLLRAPRTRFEAAAAPEPSAETNAWRKFWRDYRKRGFNVARFPAEHLSEVAFATADEAGLLLAVDVGTEAGRGTDVDVADLRRDSAAFVRQYGNHASFVILGLHPDLGRDDARGTAWLAELSRDPRRVCAWGDRRFAGLTDLPLPSSSVPRVP